MGVKHPRMTVRLGCRVSYITQVPTPVLMVVRPRLTEVQRMLDEKLTITPELPNKEFTDMHGNITSLLTLPVGETTINHDCLVEIPSYTDKHETGINPTPIEQYPPSSYRYTLPSRYCDSDKLLDFAWEHFGQFKHGAERVQAICDWTHQNIEYRFGSGVPETAASDIIAQRYGVCRDFAHVGIALARAFNLPARYVSGHLPDIGYQDPGSAMDFHAYFEVYLDHKWCTYDARFNVPRIGRVKVADGLDAVDGAFTTVFGQAKLTWFQVWSFQVRPGDVEVGDPIDVSKRIDGTPEIRYS
jgi:transglutaminase-like putative cysteine protease